MAFVEVFELTIHEGNRSDFAKISRIFTEVAPTKVPGLLRIEYWALENDSKVFWQFNDWQDEASMKAGLKHLFAIPEMSSVAIYLEYPPKRIKNLIRIS